MLSNHNRSRSLALAISNRQLPMNNSIFLNVDDSKESNNTKSTKEGWLYQQRRHYKKWKRRYVRIEQHQLLCTYQTDHDDLINSKNTIDLKESTIHYTLDKPKQFIICTKNGKHNNTQHIFQSENISEANEWLNILKRITVKNISNMNQKTDLDLVTVKPVISRVAIFERNESKISLADINENTKADDVFMTPLEINDLYMKAVSLYQHKHFEECARVIQSVLTVDPNHKQATKLNEYLAGKYNKYGNMQSKSKHIKHRRHRRVSTVGSYSRSKIKNIFGGINSTFYVPKCVKNIIDHNDEKQRLHLCQIEFQMFLTEKVQISKYYSGLNDKFVSAKYDDIRFMKDFDHNILEKEIGLRPLHCSLFLRKIKIFMHQVKLFQEAVKQIVMKQKANNKFKNITCDAIIDLFENNGILTFEQLHRYIKSKHDLERIMKKIAMPNDCDILWNEIQFVDKIQVKKSRKRAMTDANLCKQEMYVYEGVCNPMYEKCDDVNEQNEGSIETRDI